MTTATIAKDVDQMIFINADDQATAAAEQAIIAMTLKHGEELWACGFAWVTYPEKVRKGSKLDKALTAIGFTRDYTNRLQKWNPGNYAGQSIDFKEAAAQAYVDRFKKITGIQLFAGSRLD